MREQLDQETVQFLQRTLREKGPLPSKSIQAQAVSAGFSLARIWRAKAKAKVVVFSEGRQGRWFWRLPDQDQTLLVNDMAGTSMPPSETQEAAKPTGGRPSKKAVLLVQEYCYRLTKIEKKKPEIVVRLAEKQFAGKVVDGCVARPPADEATVRLYARRFERRPQKEQEEAHKEVAEWESAEQAASKNSVPQNA